MPISYRSTNYVVNAESDTSAVILSNIAITRSDGLPDTGGDPVGDRTGDRNPNPFLPPPLPDFKPPELPSPNPAPEPNPFPAPSPFTIPAPRPFPNPAPNTNPAPAPAPFPFPVFVPFPAPVPFPVPSPFPETLPAPNTNPAPAPAPAPAPDTKPSPEELAKKQREENRKKQADEKNRKEEENQSKQRKKNECCELPPFPEIPPFPEQRPCPCPEPEFVNISVKKFDRCSDKNEPVFTNEIISVLKGTETLNQKLFDGIADSQAQQCKKPPEVVALAAVPEWWQVRVGADRPQLVVLYAEKLLDGKLGRSRYAMTIPHYRGNVGDKPVFPEYQKGSWEGILVLKDNSKVIVNCISYGEANRVLNALKAFIDPQMLGGASQKIGERGGLPLKTIDLLRKSRSERQLEIDNGSNQIFFSFLHPIQYSRKRSNHGQACGGEVLCYGSKRYESDMGDDTMSSYIPMRTKCVRIRDTDKAIPLKDFAAMHHIHTRTVFYWLRTRKCTGYKTGGRWYVYK